VTSQQFLAEPEAVLARTSWSSDSSPAVLVSWERVQRFARQRRSSPEAVLGYVLAHELVHAFAKSRFHSLGGIMASSWTATETERMPSGFLRFSKREADLLHRALWRPGSAGELARR
jgi:hypothetical protein